MMVPICNDTRELKNSFVKYCFSWVKRGANLVAHVLAKHAALFNFFSVCNKGTLPSCVKKAYLRDVSFEF